MPSARLAKRAMSSAPPTLRETLNFLCLWVCFMVYVISLAKFIKTPPHGERDLETTKLIPLWTPSERPEDLDNLKPKSHCRLDYGNRVSNVDASVVAVVGLEFLGMKAVKLEDIAKLVTGVSCEWEKEKKGTGLMKVEFTGPEVFREAAKYWEFGSIDPFIFITDKGGNSCTEKGYRGIYKVRYLPEKSDLHDATPDIYLEYQQIEPESVINSLAVDFFEKPKDYPKPPSEGSQGIRRLRHHRHNRADERFDAAYEFSKEKELDVSFKTPGRFGKSVSPFGPAFRIIDTTKREDWPNKPEESKSWLGGSDADDTPAKIEAKWTDGLGVWCVDCYAKGNLKFRGSMKYHTSIRSRADRGFRKLKFSIRGDMEQKVNFGLLLASRTQNGERPAYKAEVISLDVIEPFAIPYLFSIGVSVPIEVGVNVKSDTLAKTQVGALLRWPDIRADFDITAGKESYNQSGWWPTIEPLLTPSDDDDGNIAAGLEFYANTKIQVAVEIFNSFKDTAGISHTTKVQQTIIRNRLDLAPSACNGTKFQTDFVYQVEAFAETKGRDFNEVLFSQKHPLSDSCPEAKSIYPPTVDHISTDIIVKIDTTPWYRQRNFIIGMSVGIAMFSIVQWLIECCAVWLFVRFYRWVLVPVVWDFACNLLLFPLFRCIWSNNFIWIRTVFGHPIFVAVGKGILRCLVGLLEMLQTSAAIRALVYLVVVRTFQTFEETYEWFYGQEEEPRGQACECQCICPCKCPDGQKKAKENGYFAKLLRGDCAEVNILVFAFLGISSLCSEDSRKQLRELFNQNEGEICDAEGGCQAVSEDDSQRSKVGGKSVNVEENEVAETPITSTETDPLIDFNSPALPNPRSPPAPNPITPGVSRSNTIWGGGQRLNSFNFTNDSQDDQPGSETATLLDTSPTGTASSSRLPSRRPSAAPNGGMPRGSRSYGTAGGSPDLPADSEVEPLLGSSRRTSTASGSKSPQRS
ncbi:hypothetical protein BJ508DRAFT_308677 [Ascobolus immersus RN42]|uniref:DUF7029 domain-containing protein n=1 Tax=Ascobolus immersus RN42 TaxID=1160509 RepID=A0A3N4HZ21_ASCIM|nr:hypothetical protein BJ508DRAFT_308677 [Ascobolus immersus RN42]